MPSTTTPRISMLAALLLLVLLALSASPVRAQYATDCGNSTQATFDLCITNAISNGQKISVAKGTLPEAACADVQANQPAYFCCLCTNWRSVHSCHTALCPASALLTSVIQEETQFCGACPAASTTSVVVAATSAALPTFSAVATPSAAASSSAAASAAAAATQSAAAAAKSAASAPRSWTAPAVALAVAALAASLVLA
ncbi:hypothetical protein HDU90_001007 [Geranomyces variabilis]|nr:hypothetical protein HDU90_001007 [Geranomyces variabilis]